MREVNIQMMKGQKLINKKKRNYSYLILTSGLDSKDFNKDSINPFGPSRVKPSTSPVSVLRTVIAAASSPLLIPNLAVIISDINKYSNEYYLKFTNIVMNII